jgi:hypothetical protein
LANVLSAAQRGAGAPRFIVGALRFIVMAGLVPAIHVFLTLGNLRQIRDRGFSGLHDRAACV